MSFTTRATQRVEVQLSDHEACEVATSYLCRLFQLPLDSHVNRDGHVATRESDHGHDYAEVFLRGGKPVKPTALESAAMDVLRHIASSRFNLPPQ